MTNEQYIINKKYKIQNTLLEICFLNMGKIKTQYNASVVGYIFLLIKTLTILPDGSIYSTFTKIDNKAKRQAINEFDLLVNILKNY